LKKEEVLKELYNYESDWQPEQRDLEWTIKSLDNPILKTEPHVWVTSWASFAVHKNIKMIDVVEVNHMEDTYLEDTTRIIKVFKKLGYKVNMAFGNNNHPDHRIIPGVANIPRDKDIPTLDYDFSKIKIEGE